MQVYSKSLKRLTTNFICRHLDIYPPEMLIELPNNLKTILLEQILRVKIYSDMLIDKCSRICQCQYCKNVDTTSAALTLKPQMCALVNPDVSRLIWVLEDPTADLEFLNKCRGLRSLQLYLCKVLGISKPSVIADISFSRIFQVLPHLTEFKVHNVDHMTAALITDQLLFTLCQSCPSLFSLGLEHCERLTDTCMQAVSLLPIRFLDLTNTRLSDSAFTGIHESSPLFSSLSELKLRDCLFLTNAIVNSFLVRCSDLTLLNCLGCPRLNNFDLLFETNAKLQIHFTFEF